MTQISNDAENRQGGWAAVSSEVKRNVPYDQPWLTSLLRPVLIAILVVCLDQVVMAFIARLMPALSGNYVPVILFISVLAVLVGCVTTTFLAQPIYRHRRTPVYRLAEIGLLVALVRIAIWIVTGNVPTLNEFLIHPLDTLFDGLFITGGLIVVFSWIMATDTTDDLLNLALQPDELYAMQMDRIGEMVRTSHSDRPSILRRVVTRWLIGGMLMVLLAASLQLGPSSHGLFALLRQNIQPAVIGAVVIYFLTGLLLISQGQLAVLRSRWIIDRVPSATNVLRNWPLYVLGLLLLMGALAALMPFGGTFYLAQIFAAIIGFVINTLFGILQFFMMLLMLLISLITGKSPPPPVEKPTPAPPPVMPEAQAQAAHLPLWAGGALFWVTMALLLGYAAYIYFSGRGMTFAWLRALWQSLRERWLQWFGAYQQWQLTRVREAARKAGATNADERENLAFWGKAGNLSPSQRARYLYLSLLHYAAQQGMARTTGETPLQYAPRLAQQMVQAEQDRLPTPPVPPPAADPGDSAAAEAAQREAQAQATAQRDAKTRAMQQDVQALTDAFIQARYASQPLEGAKISFLEQIWQQLKRQLGL